jgi:hypothetical protein
MLHAKREDQMAGRRVETFIDIDAPPAQVWAHLTDFARMPDWNPFIKSISGPLSVGARLAVQIAPPGKSSMRFTPTVLTVVPEREFRWLGRVLLPGVFDGEHYFLLAPLGEGRTHFTQGENFTGFLVTILGGTLSATEDGFRAMNAALKQRAERNDAAKTR